MTDTNVHIDNIFDKQNFELAFRKYFSSLCYFAQKYIPDLDTAKEIVHDGFINLWEKRDTIDSSRPIKSYLYTTVRNRCLNYIRDNKKFDHSEFQLENIENEYEWDVSDNLVANEMEEKINKIIEELPEACRNIFILSRIEGLKYAEIAKKTGISVKTVETQISKALKRLRENLIEYLCLLLLLLMKHGDNFK